MKKFVSFDLETCLIDAGLLNPPVVCAQFCDEDLQPELVDQFDAEQVIADMLACEDIVIVGANVAYDMACALAEYPRLKKLIFAAYRAGRILDVQVAQRLVDIGNGELGGTYNHHGVFVKYSYSLAALHERWGLGALQKEGTWRLRYGELRGLRLKDYPPEAVKYALDDASATMKVWMLQHHAYPHFLKDLAAQTRKAFALHLMAVRGVHTDAIACDEYLLATKQEIEDYKKLLIEHGLLRAKDGTRDTKAAKAYMVEACARAGIEPKLTAKDGICMDAEACRDVNDPVMKAYSAFVSAKTTLQRVEKLRLGSGNVPLQTRFESLVANGRVASMEPSAPLVGLNLQNLPRGGMSRQVLVPRKGYKFNSVDWTGAELHTFAQVEFWTTGKSKIGEALNAKKDLHCMLAAAYLGCTYEEAYDNRKVGEYARARQLAKAVNFGMLAAMGAQRLMDTINKGAKKAEDRISLELATELRQLWLELWDAQPYFTYVQETLQTSGGVATIEQFVSGRVRGKLSFTELANTWFSGLAADAFGAALWALTEECYCDEESVLYGSYPVLPIHDEIVAELVDTDKLHEAAFRQAEIMCDVFSKNYTPDFPVRAEPALMAVLMKAADPAYDSSGRLRCWDPQKDDKDFEPKKYLKRALELAGAA